LDVHLSRPPDGLNGRAKARTILSAKLSQTVGRTGTATMPAWPKPNDFRNFRRGSVRDSGHMQVFVACVDRDHRGRWVKLTDGGPALRILVTGGAGFIGSAVVRLLAG